MVNRGPPAGDSPCHISMPPKIHAAIDRTIAKNCANVGVHPNIVLGNEIIAANGVTETLILQLELKRQRNEGIFKN